MHLVELAAHNRHTIHNNIHFTYSLLNTNTHSVLVSCLKLLQFSPDLPQKTSGRTGACWIRDPSLN